MIRKEKNGLVWLEFEIFQPFEEIQHGILTKHGGHSHEDNLDLNTQYTTSSPTVAANLTKVQKTLSLKNLIYGTQVHKTKVQEINSSNLTSSFECDAFVTKLSEIALLIKHADCQAALFYDPVEKVIANAHCGWRGNVLNIYREIIEKMTTSFNCLAQNIRVGISPSLGPDKAEFKNFKKELPNSFWDFQVKPTYFNFWEIAKAQLVKEGINPSHIEIAQLCTFSQSKDFFSYRRDKNGMRNATFISKVS